MKISINKIYVFLCAILCCTLFLSGCATGNEKINAPVDIRYIVQNPITFTTVTETQQFGSMTYTGSYQQISGLKDQQVENKINERLKTLCEQYRPGEIPQKAKEAYSDLECIEQNVSLQCNGNFNNILSISADCRWVYDKSEEMNMGNWVFQTPTTYSLTKLYNIDLNTGEEIALKDVFADNVDYLDMIKTEAQSALQNEGIDVDQNLLQKSMEAYQKNPQFMLGNSMFAPGGIKYADPSYQNGEEREIYIYLDIDENFAITERFYNPIENIYTGDQEGEKTLLTHVGELEEWEEHYVDEGIDILLRGSNQKEFPEQIQQAIKAEKPADNRLIDEMKRILKVVAEQETIATYSKTVNTSRLQDFINIRIYEDANIFSEKTNTSYLNNSHQTLKCYRKGSDTPATIRDIFVKDADAERLLETLVFNKLEANQRLLEESGYQRSIDVSAHSEGAVNKFVGFCINHDSLFAEYLGDPALPSYVIELKYADIGYKNLNIFK